MDTEVADQLQPNQCPACTMQLASRQSLRRHWSNWHQERGREELEQYLKRAAAKLHVCPTCGKQFTRPNALHTHQEKIHQQCGMKRAPRFHCPSCQGPFYFLNDMLEHCDTVHNDQLGNAILYCDIISFH